MKIKLSKIMAAVTALGVTFAGFTAFATEEPVVTTHTNYEWDATEPDKVNCVVESTVAGVTKGKEVTYFVSNGDTDNDILYIDQKTVGEDGTVTFSFSGVTQDVLFAVTSEEAETTEVTAKYGSDANLTLKTFKFIEGRNYMTSVTGDAIVATHADAWYAVSVDTTEDNESGVTFTGSVVGTPDEYGVCMTIDEKVVHFPAKGCDATGTFLVSIISTMGSDGSLNPTTSDEALVLPERISNPTTYVKVAGTYKYADSFGYPAN